MTTEIQIKPIDDKYICHRESSDSDCDEDCIIIQLKPCSSGKNYFSREAYEITRQQRISNIKEYEMKQQSKSEEVKKKESDAMYTLMKQLSFNYFLITTCNKTIQIAKYSLVEGSKYEIISGDFRDDGNYVFMREYNENTKPLFNGNANDIFNFKKEAENISEFHRRGYAYNGELFVSSVYSVEYFLNEARVEDEKEKIEKPWIHWFKSILPFQSRVERFKKELEDIYEGIIQIPISEYVKYFNNFDVKESIHKFDSINMVIQLDLDYTYIELQYDRTLTIEIEMNGIKDNEFVTMNIYRYNDFPLNSVTYFKKGSTKVTKEFVTSQMRPDKLSIVFKKTNLDKGNIKELSSISFNFKFDGKFKINDKYRMTTGRKTIEFKEPKRYGKCELCHHDFSSIEEIYKLTENEEIYCHASCYNFAKCFKCKCKPVRFASIYQKVERMKYIPEIRGFICDSCSYKTD